MSTTRSQLYRFARDLGNVEAVEHGYKRGGFREPLPAVRSARRVGSSTGKAIGRSTTSCVPSDSDRIGVENKRSREQTVVLQPGDGILDG